MGPHGDNVLVIVGWAVGSFFLALLVLFGLFGGLLLGLLFVPLLPVLAIVVLIAAAFQGEQASSTTTDDRTVVESLAQEEHEVPNSTAPTPVLATVVDAEGTCPMNRSIKVKEAWTLNGKWSVAELCPRAEKLLTRSAAQLRSGEVQDGELCQCLGEGHRVVFQLREGQTKEAIPSA